MLVDVLGVVGNLKEMHRVSNSTSYTSKPGDTYVWVTDNGLGNL